MIVEMNYPTMFLKKTCQSPIGSPHILFVRVLIRMIMVVYICNPSFQGWSQDSQEFKASFSYIETL